MQKITFKVLEEGEGPNWGDPRRAVVQAYEGTAKIAFSNGFLGYEDAETAMRAVIDSICSTRQDIFSSLVGDEKRSTFSDISALLEQIRSELDVDNESIDETDLDIDDDFFTSIISRIEAKSDALKRLVLLKDHPRFRDHLLPFFRDIEALISSGDIDGVYDRVMSEIGSSEILIGVDEEQIAPLLLILPVSLRFAVQDMILANSVAARLDELKSSYTDPDDLAAIELFKEVCFAYARSSYHVKDLRSYLKAEYSSGTEETICEAHREFMSAMDAIFNSSSVLCTDFNLLSQVIDPMEVAARTEYRVSDAWFLIDPGHGFKMGAMISNYFSLGSGRRTTVKEGHLVILEDDPEQQDYWSKYMTGYSKYDVLGAYDNPGDIEIPSDGNFQDCYMLDIQNHGDDEAGIKVAIALLNAYVDFYGLPRDDSYDLDEQRQLKIVLMSSSFRSIDLAKEIMLQQFPEIMSCINSSSYPIQLEFTHKSKLF